MLYVPEKALTNIGQIYPWALFKNVYRTSGIEGVTDNLDSANYDIYNLQGIKVGETNRIGLVPTGIYIINGKKFSVKN